MSVSATYRLYLDLDDDGDFSEANEQVAEGEIQSLVWERGRRDPPPGHAAVGKLTATLRNPTGKYTYTNPDSPLYELIHPGMWVQLTMSIESGEEVIEWTGKLEDIVPSTSDEVLAAGTAELTANGVLMEDNDDTVTEVLQQGQDTGALMALLTGGESGVDVDSGLSTIPKWWAREKVSRRELEYDLQDAELGYFGEAKDGGLYFRNRGYYSTLSARASYGEGGFSMWEPIPESPLSNIYNSFRGNCRKFLLSEDVTLVVISDSINGRGGPPICIPAGETVVIIASLSQSVMYNVPKRSRMVARGTYPPKQTPVITDIPGDYVAVSEWGMVYGPAYDDEYGNGNDVSEDVSLVRTERGQSIKLEFTNSGSVDAYLPVLYVNGIAIIEDDPIPIEIDAEQSNLDKYGRHEYPYPSNWIEDLADGQDMANWIVGAYKTPRTRINFKIMANVSSDLLNEAQTLDLEDCIEIVDAATFGLYVDNDFIVDYLRHEVDTQIEGGFHNVYVTCTIKPSTYLAAQGQDYTPPTAGQAGPPDDLYINGIDPSGKIVIGVVARKWNSDVYEGEIRAKFFATEVPDFVDLRTVAEGGTLVHNGSTELVLTGLAAGPGGVNYQFESAGSGRWYFAGRLKNRSVGWSVWTDGNTRPVHVVNYVDMESSTGTDTGPPDDSVVRGELMGNGVLPIATRPGDNGSTILFVCAQARDANQGAWYDLDADDGPADTYYDGSGVDCIYDKTAGTITATGDFPAIPDDAMILFDVRNTSAFDLDWCQWAAINQNLVSGAVISGVPNFRPYGDEDSNQLWEHIRIKIVKAPWAWNTDGYLGDYPGRGVSGMEFYWNGQKGDRTTGAFELDIIQLPDHLAFGNIQVRVWFENKICRAECGRSSEAAELVDDGNPSGAHDLEVITHDTDPDIVPVGMMAFRYYRDTENYKNIFASGFWISSSLPGQGPYDIERAAYPGDLLEEDTCFVEEDGSITVTRSADPSVVGMLLCLYTDDADPDSDLDGNYIESEGENSLVPRPLFPLKYRSGAYNYAIITPFYDKNLSPNLDYYQFQVPDEIGGDIEAEQWVTTPVPLRTGDWYVTGADRNPYGVGTRMTASSPSLTISSGLCVTLTDADPILTNAALAGSHGEKLFVVSVDGNRTLANPTGAKCGLMLKYRIINTSSEEIIITLDTKFRNGKAFPTYPPDDSAKTGLDIVEEEEES